MKERVLFISAIIGSFSATIILLLNHALTVLGVDTTEYVKIIDMVGLGLAAVILIVAMIVLNKYNVLQQKSTIEQRGLITGALEGNATLMSTILPKLAQDILATAEVRSNNLLQNTENKINTMMNEMLPTLAEQTMQVVTEKSQTLVEETTAKAQAVMTTMDELLPTYAKQISDNVAQTVRENNAHYHKMLTDLRQLIHNMPSTPSAVITSPSSSIDSVSSKGAEEIITNITKFEQNLTNTLTSLINNLLKPDISSQGVIAKDANTQSENFEEKATKLALFEDII